VDVERGTPSSVETSFSCGGDGGGGSSSSAVYRVFCNTEDKHLRSSAHVGKVLIFHVLVELTRAGIAQSV